MGGLNGKEGESWRDMYFNMISFTDCERRVIASVEIKFYVQIAVLFLNT